MFTLSPRDGTAEWTGCVMAPPDALLNAVAALRDGTVFMTKLTARSDSDWRKTLYEGKTSGAVYRWTPGSVYAEVPGSQLAGNNGLVVSPKGDVVYVAAYGSYQIWRISMKDGKRTSVKVDFRPDNLRWTPDGNITVAGPIFPEEDASAVPGPNFKKGHFVAARVDPKSLKVKMLVKEPLVDGFPDTSTALEADGQLWISTSGGNRIAYVALPH
ncbi:hypothetical protein A9R05_21390 [Burkholderia sp. KK1]|nr:hypothetical protein A9R05_21390 [Burkholderia sp. KK1]